jgi:glutamate-5-semialdehyde dehydrogenase
MKYLEKIGLNSRKAYEVLKSLDHKKIKKILDSYSVSILKNKKRIIKENLEDIKNAKRKHLIDRLIFDDKKIDSIRRSINEISKFKDTIGRILEKWERPNGSLNLEISLIERLMLSIFLSSKINLSIKCFRFAFLISSKFSLIILFLFFKIETL